VRAWIGYNVLDWFMRDMTTKELIIMADPNRPRHYEEEFKRQIVQLYENGKPSSQIRAEYGIPRSTLVCVQLVVAGLVTMIFRV